ncbi:MAG: DUF2961 domain-containing protein [Bacteroidales bacterium]|jgi:hypothetical protein|nr:DUF2961 domain-containing protein [Bacteroidales bacterium]
MNKIIIFKLLMAVLLIAVTISCAREPENSLSLFSAPPADVETGWFSPENPTGEKGMGGLTNKGAKGNAFFVIPPGKTQVLFDIKGAGIIQRMWFSGSIANSPVQRRAVRVDMYWDGAKKPAVSAPIVDFFGLAHGLTARYDNVLFSNPEGRSFNFTIPMPFREAGLITITNESTEEVWLWYDINFLKMNKIPENAMYFHAYWNRDPKTKLGEDYEILPRVEGTGRYLGANIGVIGGDSLYLGTWFGEGEVKIYLDGDTDHPSLVGTGTEDYIGTGWGQGEYACRNFGSPVAKSQFDIYAFYRYHIADPVYFHRDCRVTIQQMGNANTSKVKDMIAKGAEVTPLLWNNTSIKPTQPVRLLDDEDAAKYFMSDEMPYTHANYYRSDDICATAYFYLDRPENNLPPLPTVELRLKNLQEKVWNKLR